MMRTENMMTLKFEDVMMSWKAVWWPPVPRRPVWDYITPDSYTGNSLCVCRALHLQPFGWMGQFSNLCCLAWMFTPLQYVYVSRGALTTPSWSPGCLAGPGRPGHNCGAELYTSLTVRQKSFQIQEQRGLASQLQAIGPIYGLTLHCLADSGGADADADTIAAFG